MPASLSQFKGVDRGVHARESQNADQAAKQKAIQTSRFWKVDKKRQPHPQAADNAADEI